MAREHVDLDARSSRARQWVTKAIVVRGYAREGKAKVLPS